VDEAIACFRKAIALDPKFAEAHCNLGQALRSQGRLTESLECYRRGHALGSKRRGWPYPSASWVRQVEQLVQQENELLDVLSGKRQPASASERISYVGLCTLTRRYEAGARLSADAFAADSTLADDQNAGHRYNAARCAALGAAGQGKNAGELPPMERLALRRQALTWLRAELGSWTRAVAAGEVGSRRLARILTPWQKDPDLAPVRDPESLCKLPEAEQVAWRNLWAQVEALLARARPRKG
jgi:tetratricopeptide (TPR) repeat protein